MKLPYVVIFRAEGREVLERYRTPQQVNNRLNALWGEWGAHGPERHREARGMLASRVNLWSKNNR